MTVNTSKSKTSRSEQKELLKLSPFELKDKLIDLASEAGRDSNIQMLNAGRGNPNWLSTTPRESFATLLQFGIKESQSGYKLPDTGTFPVQKGIADRLRSFLGSQDGSPGVNLLKATLEYGVKTLKFDADSFIYELVEGIIGCMYPVPDRMLRCSEQIVHEFLIQEMCNGKQPEGKFDIFAVEGGTAAMCYIFDSLMLNNFLHRGDTIALGIPTFTPYIEIPHFDRYEFKVVNIDASVEQKPDGTHSWQYADSEIDKLADKNIKAFFLVNPSNPPSYAMRESSIKRLVNLVKIDRPDLMIITDDVYGTFVPGFRSLMAELPQNTICVYSYSKHFGCTGWRLGVIALHQNNIYDKQLAKLSAMEKAKLNKRYSSITLDPEKLRFIDRMVADSRQVALNHTAGLSTPQQIQMVLFSSFALTDTANSYKSICQLIVRRRYKAFWDGLGVHPATDENSAAYYTELDLMVWAEKVYGPDFVKFLRDNYECTDVLFRMAEHSGVVLMHGGGFGGPDWSVRVSLANLPEDTYPKIGQFLREATESYVEEWKDSKK
jgi:aspartate 4-decarboxylase